jgi:hypothetical protein
MPHVLIKHKGKFTLPTLGTLQKNKKHLFTHLYNF